jgi:hypothetical protein
MASTLTFGTHLTGTSYDGSVPVTIGTDAASAATASTLVARDASGDFAASDITASGFFATGMPWFDVRAYGAVGDGMTDDLAAFVATFAAVPAGGGTVFVPQGTYKISATITPPASLDARDTCRVRLLCAEGAVIEYHGGAGTALFHISNDVGQEGFFAFEGGVFDGLNADSDANGVEIRVGNVRLRRVVIRRFGPLGDGTAVLFTAAAHPAVPPIRCAIEQCALFLSGRGIRSEVTTNGLDIIDSWIESCGQEGIYLADVGKVSMFGGGIESNGVHVTTSPEVVIIGRSDVTFYGVYIETSEDRDTTMISADGNGTYPLTSLAIRDCRITGYPVGSTIALDIGAAHTVQCFEATGNFINGCLTGINIGADVQDYAVGPQSWDANYGTTLTPIVLSGSNTSPGTISATRFGGGERVSAASFSFSGPSGANAVFSDAVSLGRTSADQATGTGNFYDAFTVAGRVSSGAWVRANIYSEIGNTAVLNVAADTISALGVTLQHSTSGGVLRTEDATPLFLGANAASRWQITTGGSLEPAGTVNLGATGNRIATGYFSSLVVGSGGAAVTGNSTIAGTLSGITSLTTSATIGVQTSPASNLGVTVGGTLNAVSGSAMGVFVTPTLVATANNDVLRGVRISPAATIGAFLATQFVGLNIGNISGAADNYAILTNAGKVQFGDRVGILSTSPSVAFRIAPSSTITSGTDQVGAQIQPLTGTDATGSVTAIIAALTTANSGTPYTTTVAMGLHLLDPVKGTNSTITTGYGLYIESLAAGTTNYAIHTSAGLVSLGDQVTIRSGGLVVSAGGIAVTGASSIAGALDLTGGGVLKVAGAQVVSARNTGWTSQSATASKSDLGASPTVAQLAAWASAMQAALMTHGLLGT